MSATPFRISVDQLGHATITIGDIDVTSQADGGFELAAVPGQPTQLRLYSLRAGVVEGEAMVEVHHPAPDLADRVRSLDAATMERIVLEKQGWGTDYAQGWIDTVAEAVAVP